MGVFSNFYYQRNDYQFKNPTAKYYFCGLNIADNDRTLLRFLYFAKFQQS